MKKNFPLQKSGHKPARVIESIKSDVRKYIKRERRKELPEGVDYLDFACCVGRTESEAEDVHVSKINSMIDAASHDNDQSVYVEIIGKAGRRQSKPG